MPSNDKTKYNIADFIDKEIPAEILDQLRVAGRIQQVLTPTSVSAVSTSAQESDYSTRPDLDPNKQLDNLIADTASLEDQVEQLEDLLDEHLKDMSIPPLTDSIARAAKRLGSEDGTITKDVLDTALATMDYWPMMTYGQDPVLAALVGNGKVEGDWVECNQISASLGKELTHPPRNDYESEDAVKDSGAEITEDHEKRMGEMILEILLQLWWNMLWPKFIVDAAIINPIRVSVAYPLDGVVLFFKKACGKKRFKRKKKECLKKEGPVNRLLNALRFKLLCKVPPRYYKRYEPMVEIDCGGIVDDCPAEKETEIKPTSKNSQLGDFMDAASEGECFSTKELFDNVDERIPEGFGASPECAKSAKIVLDAVLGDALTPPIGEGK